MNTGVRTETLDQFNAFILNEFGLYFAEDQQDDLVMKIGKIAIKLGFNDVEECLGALLNSTVSPSFRDVLVAHLTIGETYFFRDKNVLNTLENIILPDLIEARRSAGKTLRIWSAGCSTGEEAYTLSIILHKLIPDITEWNIQILATDINAYAMNQAKKGIYKPWSFRGVSEYIKSNYFEKISDKEFIVKSHLKKLVRFSFLNLVKDSFPTLATNTHSMDIILCRNVLMYFSENHRKRITTKFYHSLNDNGWMISSASEASANLFHQFLPVHFPEAILYQKKSKTIVPKEIKAVELKEIRKNGLDNRMKSNEFITKKTLYNTKERRQSIREKAKPAFYDKLLKLYNEGKYNEIIILTADAERQNTETADILFLISKSFANLGALTQSLNSCNRALKLDTLRLDLYYLQATLFQEMGELEKAVSALQQTIYLNPDFELAYFTLGTIFQQMGKADEAKRQYVNALSILKTRTADDILDHSEGITAGRLLEIIKTIMR
ncbi:MAG: hypothetical protein JEZ03_05730 [Bacteroidales bacterium]|nr:hypothetical protein [Bacteroidales bacterium]